MKSALAGATSTASAPRVRLMCAMLLAWPLTSRASQVLPNTGRPVSACNVSGVMNCSAEAVITTCTVAPAFTNARASSAAL